MILSISRSVFAARAAAFEPTLRMDLTLGTWFDQVKAQHAAIQEMLANIMSKEETARSGPATALRRFSHLLTAHSIAEERVLYPALAFAGLAIDSADAYLDRQVQTMLLADLEIGATDDEAGADRIDKVKQLAAMLLPRANDREEKEYYPKLQARLNIPENAVLTEMFRTQFLSVRAT